MAAEAGTGTPGANQNGPVPAPYGSPGEVVTAAGPATRNAPAPKIDITLGGQFVTQAYDLTVRGPLRSELIFDQFATVGTSNTTHRGGSYRFSFTDDIPEQITPLLENIDVDSASFGAKGLVVTQLPYGTAVTTTDVLAGTSMIAIDPMVGEKVGYNAGLSVDRLAHNALLGTSVTYDDSSTGSVTAIGASSDYVDGYMLQEAVEGLQTRKVRPMMNGLYVAVLSPRQIQHLKSDASVTGWRQAAIQADETNENSVFRGQVNIYEGCYIIMNNKLAASDKGFVMGAEALAKVYPDAPGFGPQPRTVISPVTDKLRRFASVGWYHMVGYSIFRPEAVVHLTSSENLRPRPS
jgi:N4-gp56 family major capsid protein